MKEYLDQIADKENYQKKIVEYVLRNFYDFQELRLHIDIYDFVINRIDVERALTLITPRQRFAITYYYTLGYNINEVANELGVTEEAVYKILQRGIKKIVKYCLF